MSSLFSTRARGRLLAVVVVVVAAGIGATLWQSHITAQVDTARQKQYADSAEHARAMSYAFRGAAEAIVPTVVTVETRTRPRVLRRGERRQQGENPFKGTPFEDFFNFDDEFGGFGDERFHRFNPRQEGTGSGVIIDRSGIILTNAHVVEGADEVTVRLADGREFKASDIKTDPQTDLAVLRINGAGSLPAARMGDSALLEIGDWVLAVGNPFGLDLTVSAGIISGKGRELDAGQRTRFLQTDAAINPGNSGGPLVNIDGEVIGINTAIATSSGGYQGVGFAIPINLAKWVTSQLISSGSVQRAYLGVAIEEINAELAEKFGVERREGVLVAEVYADSPAAEAGFQEGDVITQFDGKPVRTPRDLQELVERSNLDSQQTATVVRNGRTITLKVLLKAMPGDFGVVETEPDTGRGNVESEGFTSEELGLEVADMSDAQARQLGLEGYQGVLITGVLPDGIAGEKGLREGMLIIKVGKEPVPTVKEFRRVIKEQSLKDGVLLLVRTSAGNRFVVLKDED